MESILQQIIAEKLFSATKKIYGLLINARNILQKNSKAIITHNQHKRQAEEVVEDRRISVTSYAEKISTNDANNTTKNIFDFSNTSYNNSQKSWEENLGSSSVIPSTKKLNQHWYPIRLLVKKKLIERYNRKAQ